MFGELQLMSDQNSNFVSEESVDGLVEEMTSYMSVDCAQWVIHQINVGVHVETASQVDPGLLPAAQLDTPLAHQSSISLWKETQIPV